MQKEATCEERIGEHLAGRLVDFSTLSVMAQTFDGDERPLPAPSRRGELGVEATDRDEISEQAQERMWEMPLAISSHKVYRIELSYGGPQDYFEVHVDDDGDIQRITYHFLDWFDGAVRTLDGDEFETAADYARGVIPDLQ